VGLGVFRVLEVHLDGVVEVAGFGDLAALVEEALGLLAIFLGDVLVA
jgi:hypothetical protein